MPIVLTTCRKWPNLSTSDRLLRDELVRRGCDVRARPWNDAPTFDDVDADAHLLGGRTRATRRLSREHDSFVVKPLIGASGHEVELVNSRDVDAVPGRLVDEHAAA